MLVSQIRMLPLNKHHTFRGFAQIVDGDAIRGRIGVGVTEFSGIPAYTSQYARKRKGAAE